MFRDGWKSRWSNDVYCVVGVWQSFIIPTALFLIFYTIDVVLRHTTNVFSKNWRHGNAKEQKRLVIVQSILYEIKFYLFSIWWRIYKSIGMQTLSSDRWTRITRLKENFTCARDTSCVNLRIHERRIQNSNVLLKFFSKYCVHVYMIFIVEFEFFIETNTLLSLRLCLPCMHDGLRNGHVSFQYPCQ